MPENSSLTLITAPTRSAGRSVIMQSHDQGACPNVVKVYRAINIEKQFLSAIVEITELPLQS